MKQIQIERNHACPAFRILFFGQLYRSWCDGDQHKNRTMWTRTALLFAWVVVSAVATEAQIPQPGMLDETFQPPDFSVTDNPFWSLRILGTQRMDGIVVEGAFDDQIKGVQGRLMRLRWDGSIDQSFAFSNSIFSTVFLSLSGERPSQTALLPNGEIVATKLSEEPGPVASRAELVRLNPEGLEEVAWGSTGWLGPQTPWLDGFDPTFRFLAAQPDGKLLLGVPAGYGEYEGIYDVFRLNAKGLLDLDFNLRLRWEPRCADNGCVIPLKEIAFQPDGRILIYGASITAVNGTPWGSLARINPDGSLDTSFRLPLDEHAAIDKSLGVHILALPDGKVLLGGYFNSDQRSFQLVRLLSDGSLDGGFRAAANGFGGIVAMALQMDGRIVTAQHCGGDPDFPFSCDYILRFNSNGSLDARFNLPVVTGIKNGTSVNSIAIQSDGKILIAGSFNSINGIPRSGIARFYGDPVPIITSSRMANGAIHLIITAESGQRLAIDASEDLKHWLPIRTNTVTSSMLQFDDLDAAKFTNKFYRMRLVPE